MSNNKVNGNGAYLKIMNSILIRFLIFIILPISLVIGYYYSTMNFGLPQVRGVINVEGIVSDVQISRDEHAAVYIKADSDEDVFFGLGFAHAQDRLWQLELQRRIAQGRLSEVFGVSSVRIDAQMRTLDLYQSALSAWEALSPQAQASLTAYSAGINALLKTTDSLPIEFSLFDITPEPWTELDSLAWIKVFALNLSSHMWNDITRFLAKSYLTNAQGAELFAGYPKDGPVTVTSTETTTVETLTAMVELQDELQQNLKIGGEFVGSNAWVISGQLTDNGQAILANDPHVGIQMPSIWYMANLKGAQINASGMSIVGLPVIIFGRNQKIAWGGTVMMLDAHDFYFEQVNASNAKQYLNNGQWLDFDTQKHHIKVRPEIPLMLREAIKPVEVVVRTTIRGPVVSDVFGLSDQPVSLRWTALDQNDTSYETFFRLNYANDWGEFKSALSHHGAPALNFLYADQAGNIGYLGAGKNPIRAKGQGQIPVMGGASEYDWTGYVPAADWPQSYNPERGYIVSANNKVISDDYPYHISYDWAPPDRAKRIEQLISQELNTNNSLSLDYMKKIQGDTVSYGAVGLLTLLKSAPMESRQQKLAQQYIAKWSGDMEASSQGASIFYNWARQLRIVLFKDELSVPFGRTRQRGRLKRSYMSTSYNQIEAALTPGGAEWCDDISTKIQESCQWVMQHALDLAIKDLTKLAGSDMDNWTWGDLLTTVYSHIPFSQVNLLKPFFERRISSRGGPNTVNVSSPIFVESEGFEQSFGAGFRQIIGFGVQHVDHLYMNSTGQSGNVFSRHYDDMVEPFRDVRYVDLNKGIIETELVLKENTTITKQSQE